MDPESWCHEMKMKPEATGYLWDSQYIDLLMVFYILATPLGMDTGIRCQGMKANPTGYPLSNAKCLSRYVLLENATTENVL